MAQMQPSEVQGVFRICDSEKETQVYCDKHLLDMFTCFAGFQLLATLKCSLSKLPGVWKERTFYWGPRHKPKL